MKTYERQTIRSSQGINTHSSKGATSKARPYSQAVKTSGAGLEGHRTVRGRRSVRPNEAPSITPDMLANAFLNGLILFLVAFVVAVLAGVTLG